MLGWAIGFLVAALVAAMFGFGGVASAFTGLAVILFWVFLALFVISLIFNAFGGAHAAGHGGSGATFAKLALVAGVALIVYAWVDHDMSAERVGAEIDETTVQLAEGASDALSETGGRAQTFMEDTSADIADNADAAADDSN